MSAGLPALFRDELLIFRGEWNLFADYFVSLQRNFNEILMRRELNITNGAKRMAEFLGHSKDLITLSLSLRRSPVTHLLRMRAPARQYTAFFAEMQGKPACFLSPCGGRTGGKD
jgi:hypothetical protein